MRDVQDLMKTQLAKERPKRSARSAPAGPRQIVAEPTWVAVCFAGEPRFLKSSQRAGWAVAMTPQEAYAFADKAAAEAAIADFKRRHAGSTHDAGSTWSALEMTLKATFS